MELAESSVAARRDLRAAGNAPLVSVVVTTKNSARTLEVCLASVRRQTHLCIELIVVDNASTDATRTIAARFADAIMDAGPERSRQRNAGIRAAGGEYALILDADMELAPDVVASCLRAAMRGASAVAIPEVSFGEGFWSRCKVFERSFYTADLVSVAARFFRRDLLLELGGYDETLTGPEDWDMSMRAAARGGLAFADAVIRHDEGRQSLRALFAKKYYYGRSMPAFVRKHGAHALKRLSPLRGSLLRGIPRMLLQPRLGVGLVTMKSVETVGGLLGMLDARTHRSETLYRPG